MSSRNKTLRFYLLGATALAALPLLEHLLSRFSWVEDEITTLTPLQEKQLEIFVDMNKLLVTFATLALGGIGAFVFNRYKSRDLPWYQVKRVVAAWVFCGLSLYCGVRTNIKLIWMLQSGFFNLTNPRILWVYEAQFVTLAIAIVLLADFLLPWPS